MKIRAHRNLRLHSESTPGGLVEVNRGRAHIVPDDVTDHPGFDLLKKSGFISVLQSDAPVTDEVDDADVDDADDDNDEKQ